MFKFSRLVIIYAIAAPLALALGYLVASPNKLSTAVIMAVVSFLALPILLRWHHPLLIFFWNSAFTAGFLPGSPDAWMFFAAISFGIAFVNHIVFQKQFLRAPMLTWPMLFLAAVVLFTAWYRGGIGLNSLGGGVIGGRYYVIILLAIAGYFAMTSEQIPLAKASKEGGIFFASALTSIFSNIIFVLGPAFYILYNILPAGLAYAQAASEYSGSSIDRISGLSAACTGFLCFLFSQFGLRGLFDFSKPWRLLLLGLTIGAAFFGGFRSIIFLLFMIGAFQFYFERLAKTHFLPIILGLTILGLLPILAFSSRLPATVQRAISFLPVNVDPDVLADAKGSSEWRFEMWAVAAKEIPKYLWLGKGYGMDATTLFLVNEATRTGISVSPFEGFLLAGDYHSGPLSLIIPFGIPGVIGFLWLLGAGWRVLYLNYRYGDARLRKVNTVLLAYYLSYCISFFFIFGAFNTELYVFTGACGLSVCLNGGVKRRAAVKRKPLPAPMALVAQPG